MVALAILVVLKLCLLLFASPLDDETYYWLWGQQLALSYHDHPPLLAWVQRASFEIFGWNLFALRAMSIVTTLVSAAIVAYWGNRLVRGSGATAVVIMLASPMFFLFQTVAYPDPLLVALLLGAGHFFAVYLASVYAGQSAQRYLFAAAIVLGFAGLAKYNAVFVGLGFAYWFLATPQGRSELRTSGPWLAGILAVAMQAPVLLWNMGSDYSSFRFHLGQRYNSGYEIGRSLRQLFFFFLLSVAFLSPFLVAPLVRFFRRGETGPVMLFQRFARPAFILSIIVFTIVGLFTQAYYYWNIAGLTLLLPVAIGLFRSRRAIMLHAGYGTLAAVLITVNYAVIPVAAPFGGQGPDNRFFGWDYLAQEVQDAAEANDATLLLGSDYRFAAQLGFQLKRNDIYAVANRADQYDYWFKAEEHTGADAIILDETEIYMEPVLENMFEEVTLLKTVTTERFGFPLATYRIYLGKNLGGR